MPTKEQILESAYNGQWEQAFEQFKALGEWETNSFINECKSEFEIRVLKNFFNKIMAGLK